MDINPTEFKTILLSIQNNLVNQLQSIDPDLNIQTDQWIHKQGGGGITKVCTGKIIEQGGVNFSHVKGESLPASATAHRPELANLPFEAMGVSTVIHPVNPNIPTAHMNVRLFIAYPKKNNSKPIWWFGGGFDLTPYLINLDDFKYWHQCAKRVCDLTDKKLYPELKKWADDYFYLKHRKEWRGIGGLFFDDFNQFDFQTSQDFTARTGEMFIEAYTQVIRNNLNTPYSEDLRRFQSFRRGRYVEFNLVYDRGTLFGLQSNGRTESILMSLPPIVRWGYQYSPQPNTPEFDLVKLLQTQPKDWI